MRNLKFVRWSAVLLGFVVLRTKAQNGFCPMCTKGCCIVLTRSKPFWGQFWVQICKTDSHTHRLNTCAALVPLRNAGTYITGFTQVKSPTNRYISFTLRQEVVRRCHATAAPAHRLRRREKRPCLGAFKPHRHGGCPAKYRPKFPAFGAFLPKNGFSCAGFAQTGFTCTGKACTNKY